MSFLQPMLLLGLPLVLLPIVIHLIHQRRFQTVRWGATRFLLAANQVSRGHARLKRWLILAARVAAIGALIFAVGRPLTSSWLGAAAGQRADTAIILLDRSPSMTARGDDGRTKLASALDLLQRTLQVLKPARTVLIESVQLKPISVESPQQLGRLPQTAPAAVATNLPALVKAAQQYIVDNQAGRCDVWIVSDLRARDWEPDSGLWATLRDAFAALPNPIQFHLLALTKPVPANRAVRVTDAQQVNRDGEPWLRLSLTLQQSGAVPSADTIPIQLDINGASTRFSLPIADGVSASPTIEMAAAGRPMSDARRPPPAAPATTLAFEHTVRLAATAAPVWGRVALDPDRLRGDDQFYFVCDPPRPRRSLIVAAASQRSEPLRIAASLATDADVECLAETLSPDQWASSGSDEVALVIWHAAIPDPASVAGKRLSALADRGGRVIFFPPREPTAARFAGVGWTTWRTNERDQITAWVGDQDLLAATQTGRELPVEELSVSRTCGLTGEYDVLAQLDEQTPVLVRARSPNRNVYFCTTTVAAEDSNLADQGIVLYAMIHRALQNGFQAIQPARMLEASRVELEPQSPWQPLAGDPLALSHELPAHAGVYRVGERWWAVNRSLQEDVDDRLTSQQAASLFGDLPVTLVEVADQDNGALAREIWQLCLWLMLAALLIEAALCVPAAHGRTTVAGTKAQVPAAVANL